MEKDRIEAGTLFERELREGGERGGLVVRDLVRVRE